MAFYDRAWVIARSGDFDKVLDPYLQYPSLGAGSLSNPTLKTTKTISFDPRYDPVAYAMGVLEIDPLLLVSHREELELKSLHRYGYVFVNVAKQRYEFVYPHNPSAPFAAATASGTRRFRLTPDADTPAPKHYRGPSQLNGPSTALLDAAYIKAASDLAAETLNKWDGPIHTSVAKVDCVDWLNMIRENEADTLTSLEAVLAARGTSDKVVEFPEMHKANSTEFRFLLNMTGLYGRPSRWIPTADPEEFLEFYSLYRLIPPVLIRSGELHETYPGGGTSAGWNYLRSNFESGNIKGMYDHFLAMQRHLEDTVFGKTKGPFFIGEFRLSSKETLMEENVP